MSAAPRFLLDENVHLAVAEGLRRRGFDAVHLREFGWLGAADHLVLERAVREHRLVVTRDLRDFSPLAGLYRERGKPIPGILILSGAFSSREPGHVIKALADWVARWWDPPGIPGGITWVGPASQQEGAGGVVREQMPSYAAALDRLATLEAGSSRKHNIS